MFLIMACYPQGTQQALGVAKTYIIFAGAQKRGNSLISVFSLASKFNASAVTPHPKSMPTLVSKSRTDGICIYQAAPYWPTWFITLTYGVGKRRLEASLWPKIPPSFRKQISPKWWVLHHPAIIIFQILGREKELSRISAAPSLPGGDTAIQASLAGLQYKCHSFKIQLWACPSLPWISPAMERHRC